MTYHEYYNTFLAIFQKMADTHGEDAILRMVNWHTDAGKDAGSLPEASSAAKECQDEKVAA